MEEIFLKKYHHRTFIVMVILCLCTYTLFRFFLLPFIDENEKITLAKFIGILLDTLIASFLITIIISYFIWFITPKKHLKSTISVIEPKEINQLLKQNTFSTKKWIYKGTCGRFTRAMTLPILAKYAREDSLGRTIDIYLLNPLNERLCKDYAIYRSGLKSGSKQNWTQKIVQEEILASTISALKYSKCEPLLDVRLFYLDTFSSFRFDISDEVAVVTKEDPMASALSASKGSYFYDSYLEDIRVISKHSQKIDLSNETNIDLDQNLRKCCIELLIKDYFNFDTQKLVIDYNSVACKVNSPSDPYS